MGNRLTQARRKSHRQLLEDWLPKVGPSGSLTLQLACELSASLLTLVSMWAYGNQRTLGPTLGLTAQVPWWTLMIHQSLWGLLPLNIAMAFIHARNLWKWRTS